MLDNIRQLTTTAIHVQKIPSMEGSTVAVKTVPPTRCLPLGPQHHSGVVSLMFSAILRFRNHDISNPPNTVLFPISVPFSTKKYVMICSKLIIFLIQNITKYVVL